jgi:hypothetical protein
MPPRDDELPEGTDHIINGAMETGAGAGASTGSSGSGFGGVGAGGTMPGGSGDFSAGSSTTGSSGFIGGLGDDTGGFTSGGSGGLGGGAGSGGLGGGGAGGSDFGGSSGSFGSTGQGGSATEQVKANVQSLTGQATDKVRSYAVDGKNRATTALDDLSQVVNEAAQSIDDRLGAQYGEYARRAATAVSGFADTMRGKDVDELFDDARQVVRKSPGMAIGAAALIGFTLVRLVKAGIPDQNKDVDFKADPQLGGPSTGMTGMGTTGIGTTGTTSMGTTQAPYVAPTTGV